MPDRTGHGLVDVAQQWIEGPLSATATAQPVPPQIVVRMSVQAVPCREIEFDVRQLLTCPQARGRGAQVHGLELVLGKHGMPWPAPGWLGGLGGSIRRQCQGSVDLVL